MKCCCVFWLSESGLLGGQMLRSASFCSVTEEGMLLRAFLAGHAKIQPSAERCWAIFTPELCEKKVYTATT